jgi:predicted nucleotidyltransferase component of viral defense system
VDNPWYQESTEITTYQLEELLGTKLRALYQRKKGRDLFDLYYALTHLEVDIDKVIECFLAYMEHEDNKAPTASEFELNLEEKKNDDDFTGDIISLLRPEIEYDHAEAKETVSKMVFPKM